MKFPRFLFAILVLAGALLLSACSGTVGNASWPGVTADETTAYVAYNTQIHAVDLSNGLQKWVYPEKANAAVTFYTAPALTQDGQLLVPGYDHKLYSLDPATGVEKWRFELAKDIYVTSPLVITDAIYAPNTDGKLYALNLQGSPLWDFKTGQHLWATPAYDAGCNCLYQPSMDHYVYALNASSGAQLWKSEDLGAAIVAQPALGEDGTLYVGTFSGEMLALSSQTGAIRWRFQAAGWIFSGAVLNGNNLLFGDMKGNLYMLSASTGSKVWEVAVGDEAAKNAIVNTPLIQDQTIYVSTETDTIYTYSLEGVPGWTKTLTNKVYAPILPSGSNLLVAVNDINAPLQAISLAGADVWTFSLKK